MIGESKPLWCLAVGQFCRALCGGTFKSTGGLVVASPSDPIRSRVQIQSCLWFFLFEENKDVKKVTKMDKIRN